MEYGRIDWDKSHVAWMAASALNNIDRRNEFDRVFGPYYGVQGGPVFQAGARRRIPGRGIPPRPPPKRQYDHGGRYRGWWNQPALADQNAGPYAIQDIGVTPAPRDRGDPQSREVRSRYEGVMVPWSPPFHSPIANNARGGWDAAPGAAGGSGQAMRPMSEVEQLRMAQQLAAAPAPPRSPLFERIRDLPDPEFIEAARRAGYTLVHSP